MKIAIGADHAGYKTKEIVKKDLIEKGYEVIDFGTNSEDSVDYPDFVHPVAESIEIGESALGVIFCGSGNGAAMTANKHKDVRAAIAWNEELAALARQHNDANILSIPSRFIKEGEAERITDSFLKANFEGGRHARRVGKISSCM